MLALLSLVKYNLTITENCDYRNNSFKSSLCAPQSSTTNRHAEVSMI